VIVDLPVGQETLLLTLDDQPFEFGLLALSIDGHMPPWKSEEKG
jgi:hypothetical protein